VLEIRSREISVKEDLPAWCRLVGHTLVTVQPGEGTYTHYYVRKQQADTALKADVDKARAFVWSARVRWTEGMQARAFIRNHSFTVGQPASFDTQDRPQRCQYLLGAIGAVSPWGSSGGPPSAALKCVIWKSRCRPKQTIFWCSWGWKNRDIRFETARRAPLRRRRR
jgi:hypothetical protein